MLFTSTQNQKNLPRYFSRVFDMACNMNFGQLDFALSDGRVFRAIGRNQGPIAQLNIHNPDIFARLIREGIWGFVMPIWISGGVRQTCRRLWI